MDNLYFIKLNEMEMILFQVHISKYVTNYQDSRHCKFMMKAITADIMR
jgi:hypothetical protein